jgi:hypothetical protein
MMLLNLQNLLKIEDSNAMIDYRHPAVYLPVALAHLSFLLLQVVRALLIDFRLHLVQVHRILSHFRISHQNYYSELLMNLAQSLQPLAMS